MASAGFAIRRSFLTLPILPRNQSARYHDRYPEGRKQCDDHRDHRGKGFGHRGSAHREPQDHVADLRPETIGRVPLGAGRTVGGMLVVRHESFRPDSTQLEVYRVFEPLPVPRPWLREIGGIRLHLIVGMWTRRTSRTELLGKGQP
jgi:hypothetical protein